MHRIFLFQENQIRVDDPMQLQLRRKMYARTFFWTYLDWYDPTVPIA